jgi:CheY-like chemotaxis protein
VPKRPNAKPRAAILVAEDNEDLREVLALILESAGHEVRTAANGNEALDLLTGWVPDAVFCDVHMPKMDGCELLKRMRAVEALSSVPVVAISGSLIDEAGSRWVELGFNAHLMKPVSPEALRAELGRLLRSS